MNSKVVFDTNVLLSATLSTKGTSYKLVKLAAEGKIKGYTSKALLDEFSEIIQRDYQVPKHKVSEMVETFQTFLTTVKATTTLNVVKEDPDDDRVLECAVSAKANFIASWDPHLTNRKHYKSIQIANPGKLLDVLKEK